MLMKVQCQTATIFIKIREILFYYLYLSLAGNIIGYTPNQGTNREKTLIILVMKKKMPTLVEKKHLIILLFLHGPRLFHLSTEKVRARFVGNGHQGGYSRADTINNDINKR